jgi:hypothetical protein
MADAPAATPVAPEPTPTTAATAPVRPALGRQGTDVRLVDDGPWIAQLTGFDYSDVRSVVYWVRDAKEHWYSSSSVGTAPFEAPITWWVGHNGGNEVVTAHVTLQSGRTIKDPGGWHSFDGRRTNPMGTSRVLLNTDGSAGATYEPTRHMSDISWVDFWLRNSDGRWARAGKAAGSVGGVYAMATLNGSQNLGWNGDVAALSIHVVWPNGTEFIDPVPWVWSDHFQPAPVPSPTPSRTPTPTPPPAPTPIPPPTPPTAAPVAVPPPAPAAPNDPYADATAAGASAVCADGSWSFSQTRSGTCSHHGGVHWWTGNLGPPGPGAH